MTRPVRCGARGGDQPIAYLHLADSQGLEPGKGHLGLGNVFRGLARMDYDGYASMECDLSGAAKTTLPAAVQHLRDRIAAATAAVARAGAS